VARALDGRAGASAARAGPRRRPGLAVDVGVREGGRGCGRIAPEPGQPRARRAPAGDPGIHGRDAVGARQGALGVAVARQKPVRRRQHVQLGPERRRDRRVQPGLELHGGLDAAATWRQHASQQGGLHLSLNLA
jgi:hypothetical protein